MKYPENGQFNLRQREDIREIVRKEDVPNKFGVYLIFEGLGCKGTPIYIGSSGRMKSNGTFSRQGIRKRLGMKQDGVYRNEFFIAEMEKRQSELSFAWFITFNDSEQKTLPAYAEAEMMQEFYDLHGRLPELNKHF